MRRIDRIGGTLGRRTLAVSMALLWMFFGVLPGLHVHGSDLAAETLGHDSGPTASAGFEIRESSHPEACGLCAKILTFDGLGRARATLCGEHVAERAERFSGSSPSVSSGRHGASRAPPVA